MRDDTLYVLQNPLVKDDAGLWKIWCEPGKFVEYYPIEESLLWFQWHWWGDQTFGYHLTSVLLHLVSAFLVWRLLARFNLRFAWLGGLLFAVHPAQVESVAWISELKNTLSLPFALLTMIFWIDYEETKKPRDYRLAIGFFLVSMLCKISFALFPLVILLYAWWKRQRIGWNDLRVSVPFFTVSIILGLMTVRAGQRFALDFQITTNPIPIGGFLSHLALAGTSLSFYFIESLFPLDPLPLYPQWSVNPFRIAQLLPWLVSSAMLVLLWFRRQTWGRHALLGLGFFIILMLPFLGFITVSFMQFTWVMDHFLYLPVIGIIGLVVAALGQISSRLSMNFNYAGCGLVAIILGLLALRSHVYAASFASAETLWIYLAQHSPGSWRAHINLGTVYLTARKTEEARQQFEMASAINPDNPESYNNLGCIFAMSGRKSEAIQNFRRAIQNDPYYLETYNNLATFYYREGRLNDAIVANQKAVNLVPNDPAGHRNLEAVLALAGRWDDAAKEDEASIRLNPDDANAHNRLGKALVKLGRITEAREQFQDALRIDPNLSEAESNLLSLSDTPGKN